MNFQFRPRLILSAMIALGAGLVAGLTGTASAQFGEAAGIAEIMQPDFYRRDIRVFDEGLKLDSTQRVIVDALFGDYEDECASGLERMKQRFEDMRPDLQSQDQKRIMTLVFAPFKDWSVEKNRLSEGFLENVKVVLTQEQLEAWPSVERRLYREKKLAKSGLSGEGLNLFYVVRDMHYDERTALQIQPVMEAYDIALDLALHRREALSSGAQNDLLDAMAEQDSQKRITALDRHIKLQIAVRNVNDQFIEQIAAALSDDKGKEFRAAALERAYPSVYRETPVQRLFKQAKEIEGLTSEVLSAVRELEVSFLTDLDGVNRQLYAAVREIEPVQARGRAEDFDRRMSGQTVETRVDPTRELFKQRDELSRTYAKRLQELLTPEQFAMLPGAFRWVEAPPELAVDPALGMSEKEGGKRVPTKDSPRGSITHDE